MSRSYILGQDGEVISLCSPASRVIVSPHPVKKTQIWLKKKRKKKGDIKTNFIFKLQMKICLPPCILQFYILQIMCRKYIFLLRSYTQLSNKNVLWKVWWPNAIKKYTILRNAILMKQLLAREGIELNFESVSKTDSSKGPTIWRVEIFTRWTTQAWWTHTIAFKCLKPAILTSYC